MTWFRCIGNNSGGSIGAGICLFNDGEWQNQDKIDITAYLGTIQNGKLVFNGQNAGIIVSQVNVTKPYILMIDVEVDTSTNLPIQAGRCNPTSDLSNVINTGEGRLSWTDDNLPANNTTYVEIKANSNSQGVFFGGGYRHPNVSYKIKSIWYREFTNYKFYN